MSLAETEVLFVSGEDDPVAPVRLEHRMDEVMIGGEPDQAYNYLAYRFERDGAALAVRVYMDEADRALLSPPEPGGAMAEPTPAAERLRQDVLCYLARRFRLIEELGEAGYEPVWIASEAWRSLLAATARH